ncbi:MAG: hypothetical protein HKN45_02630, partial [Flavobacteriales bacterium]|nr:hypothetical protein [Flavobacteriales bacterium]
MKTTLTHLASTFLLLFISTVSYGTDISATITSDVTLTLANSPYNVTSDYIVPAGFTLTIEPGVEIFLNGTNKDIFI